MRTIKAYVINTLRVNGIIMFMIVQVLCTYFVVVRPTEVSAPLQALWYTAALDCLISSAVIVALKNKR